MISQKEFEEFYREIINKQVELINEHGFRKISSGIEKVGGERIRSSLIAIPMGSGYCLFWSANLKHGRYARPSIYRMETESRYLMVNLGNLSSGERSLFKSNVMKRLEELDGLLSE